MKKYAWMMMVAIALATWIIPVCSSAENLIQNGGFEHGLDLVWYPINYLGNYVAAESNSSNGIAIEGGSNLHVVITNSAPLNTWWTSLKYPIPGIVYPGSYMFSFTVVKLSQDVAISAGVMDDIPPDYKAYGWTGLLDLSDAPVGVPVVKSLPVIIPYQAWNLAVSLNLAGANQNIIIDNVRLEKETEIVPITSTTLSGSIINATNYSFSKLYVVLYPEGDAFWNDENAVIVPVTSSLARGKAANWTAVVPSGSKYSIEVYSQTGAVYKRVTRPWTRNNDANVDNVSGVDFRIVCGNYKTTTSWTSLGDACYK